jgi:predicted phage terminase large subunit-like protein
MAIDEIKVSLCKKFYIEHNGRHLDEVQRLMREAGYATFNTRCLHRNCGKPGYIERFNWKDDVAEPPASAGGRARENRSTPNTTAGTATDFPAWLKKVSNNYTWHWRYQQHIYEKLENVTSGECKRLMIFMPPRHGKSELVTVRYAAWRLQRDPSLNIILGSYNQKLANRFSRKIRNVLAVAEQKLTTEPQSNGGGNTSGSECAPWNVDKESGSASGCTRCADNSDISPPRLCDSVVQTPFRTKRANTAEEWELPAGGGVRAVGVGAGVTGFGAKLVIIDDPVKSRAEAESSTYRDRLSDWFNDDIYTRLEPDAAIILIQTRWHEDDLAGRLLKDMHDGGEEWDVISFPALAEAVENGQLTMDNARSGAMDGERLMMDDTTDPDTVQCPLSTVHSAADALGRLPGEPLCPERFNTAALERIKRRLGSYSFAALYQQRPAPIDGGLFKRAWFTVVDHAPKGLKWKRGYDLALSTKTSADYTASFRCAFDGRGTLYIDGGFRKRIEFPEQKRYILERMLNESDTEHGIESALHGAAFVQELRRTPGFLNRAFRSIRVTGDKFTRALAWANKAEEGSLRLVRGAWNDTFIDEACSFPNSAHDDQIDAVSIAVEMLTKKKMIACSF